MRDYVVGANLLEAVYREENRRRDQAARDPTSGGKGLPRILEKGCQESFRIPVCLNTPRRRSSASFPSSDGLTRTLFLRVASHGGLYYYLCNVPKRRGTAKAVVLPLMMELLESRFNFVNPSLLRKQILGGATHGDLAAADLSDEYGRQYERLFHQKKLKMISNDEFIRNLDDLLDEFHAVPIEVRDGAKTPQFNLLVDDCGGSRFCVGRRSGEYSSGFMLLERAGFIAWSARFRIRKSLPSLTIATTFSSTSPITWMRSARRQ